MKEVEVIKQFLFNINEVLHIILFEILKLKSKENTSETNTTSYSKLKLHGTLDKRSINISRPLAQCCKLLGKLDFRPDEPV